MGEEYKTFNKYSWPIMNAGLEWLASYPSRSAGSHPRVLLQMPNDARAAVQQIWQTGSVAEVYCVKNGRELGFVVMQSTNMQSPDKVMVYPRHFQPIVQRCIEESVKLADLSPLKVVWHNTFDRVPFFIMPILGALFLWVGYVGMEVFISPLDPNELHFFRYSMLVITCAFVGMGSTLLLGPLIMGLQQRWKLRRALKLSAVR